jgi:hypothetical protein
MRFILELDNDYENDNNNNKSTIGVEFPIKVGYGYESMKVGCYQIKSSPKLMKFK